MIATGRCDGHGNNAVKSRTKQRMGLMRVLAGWMSATAWR